MNISLALKKRKARKLMLPMIRWYESNSCGWELARYIRPDLASNYDKGAAIVKQLMDNEIEWDCT